MHKKISNLIRQPYKQPISHYYYQCGYSRKLRSNLILLQNSTENRTISIYPIFIFMELALLTHSLRQRSSVSLVDFENFKKSLLSAVRFPQKYPSEGEGDQKMSTFHDSQNQNPKCVYMYVKRWL